MDLSLSLSLSLSRKYEWHLPSLNVMSTKRVKDEKSHILDPTY